MLFPKKVKFRKWHSTRNMRDKRRMDTRGISVAFGSHGLVAEEYGRISSNQIESARKVISRNIKKVGKMWIRVFPDRPVTKKAAEVGMGSGKGDPVGYAAQILPGRILFEVDGLSEVEARAALVEAGSKLPVKTRVVSRV